MAISRSTLRLTKQLRTAINRIADTETRRLIQAWVTAWDQITPEVEAAVADLIAVEPGQWPSRTQVDRASRAQRALTVAEQQLTQLTQRAGIDLAAAVGEAVTAAAEAQPGIIASQMPPAAGTRAELAVRFDRVDPQAISWIVERTTEQIENVLNPLSAEATTSMRRALIRGVAIGDNPREAARRMVRGLEGEFNGGLTRALVIARTEILDAHRRGAMAQHLANRDVLAGWVWHCQLDRRSCPSCWSKHGTVYPLSQQGPMDHQQGRCSRTPRTKSWADLGFTTKEPPDLLPDAQTAFKELPHADQLKVMGPARLDALDRGAISWTDLSQRRTTAGWRDSFGVTPVRDLAHQ